MGHALLLRLRAGHGRPEALVLHASFDSRHDQFGQAHTIVHGRAQLWAGLDIHAFEADASND